MFFKQWLEDRMLETWGNSARDKACWTNGFNGIFDDLRGESIFGGCKGFHVPDNIS